MKTLTIGYFADGPWAHNTFDLLIGDKSLKLAFICVRNDSQDAVLMENATRYGIPLLKHPNINSQEFLDRIRAFQCDILVSMSFNQIFKTEIINLTPYKAINCHAGKLPFYRGRNILNWALINDEKEFGITVHYIDEGIDTGDIILQRSYPITDSDNYRTLLERAYVHCAEVLYESISMLKNGKAKRIRQHEIHPVGFYCSKREPGDEIINWNQSSREIFNFIRSICFPGPQARTFCNGQEIRINAASMLRDAPIYKGNPGQIVGRTADSIIVKTKDTTIQLIDYTSPGKLRMGDRLTSKSQL